MALLTFKIPKLLNPDQLIRDFFVSKYKLSNQAVGAFIPLEQAIPLTKLKRHQLLDKLIHSEKIHGIVKEDGSIHIHPDCVMLMMKKKIKTLIKKVIAGTPARS